MALIDKLSLLNLSEKEEKKAVEKFMATLALVSEKELKENLELLSEHAVDITKANELKVLTNSKEELAKKFSILDEIHHTGIYVQDPNMINHNVIDLYKMLKYYEQNNIPYKDEEGKYIESMFSEKEWQENSLREEKEETTSQVEDNIIALDPLHEKDMPLEEEKEDLVSFSEFENPVIPDVNVEESNLDFDEDLKDIDTNVSSFADIRAELENQLKELDNLKQNQSDEIKFDDNVISFNDIEPESFGMEGRAI